MNALGLELRIRDHRLHPRAQLRQLLLQAHLDGFRVLFHCLCSGRARRFHVASAIVVVVSLLLLLLLLVKTRLVVLVALFRCCTDVARLGQLARERQLRLDAVLGRGAQQLGARGVGRPHLHEPPLLGLLLLGKVAANKPLELNDFLMTMAQDKS